MVYPHDETMRFDLQTIAGEIPPKSRVLDLGCGNGELLTLLAEQKGVEGTGIEQDEEKVLQCISRGLRVLHGNIQEEVKDFADASFDYVILSQTLQQVFEPAELIKSLARIGRRVIVSFPNFSHHSIRLYLLFTGLAPKNKLLPYSWYDTPNIRVITLSDFRQFAREVGYTVIKETAIKTNVKNNRGREIRFLKNLRASYGICVIEKTVR